MIIWAIVNEIFFNEMGVYLSTACTDFSYEEGLGNGLHFFVGEMQVILCCAFSSYEDFTMPFIRAGVKIWKTRILLVMIYQP